jgi:hypothetical protein
MVHLMHTKSDVRTVKIVNLESLYTLVEKKQRCISFAFCIARGSLSQL